jgi:hypothetical protein
VQWVSHTGCGKDGILLKIVVPAAGDTNLGDGPMTAVSDGLTEDDRFVFETGPLTVEFPLMEIQDLDSLIMVDEHNGVSFIGFDRDDIELCPRGALEGAWVRVRDDEFRGGFFRAKWMGPLGRVLGHVRGRWGVLPDGERVFVGKIIGRRGEYIGHMRGVWEPADDNPRHGIFAGRWGVCGSDRKGGVRGRWVVSDRIEHGGFLRGVWKSAGCEERKSET